MKTALKIPREMELARTAMWARVENNDYGTCPLCKGEMTETSANGISVIACLKDRVVLPAKSTQG